MTWYKALFDKNSEGIEDGVLRYVACWIFLLLCHVVTYYQFNAPQDAVSNRCGSFSTCSSGCCRAQTRTRHSDTQQWNSLLPGTTAWLDPSRDCVGPCETHQTDKVEATLLSASLWLLTRVRFQSSHHLNVLRTIMLSPDLPRPVLTLCGPSVVRLLSEWRGGTQSFDVPALRQEVIKATGISVSGSVSLLYPCLSSETPHLPEPKEPILNSPSPSWADQSRRAVQDALVLLQSGKPPFLNVAACLVETPAIEFLQTFWLALDLPIKTDATADAAKRLAVFVLATPRASPTPPLLPIFLHNLLPSLIDRFDNPNLGQAMTGDLELLIAIISSSLMAALQLERALYTASGEQAFVLGSSSSVMASRLALGLRHRKSSSKGKLIAQRLTSSQTFVANFPVFKTEI
jgi:mediator of RNA polymerase II transcription subunit 5